MDGPLYWPSDKNVLLLPSYKEETMFLCCPLYLDLHKYPKKIINSGNSLEKEDKRKKITKKLSS